MPENNQLVAQIEGSNLESAAIKTLKETFIPLYDSAKKIIEESISISVTDESQTEEMEKAKVNRKALQEIRINTEKERKKLKEESLRKGQVIDGIGKFIREMIEKEEDRLETLEKFVELKRAKEVAELQAQRVEIITKFGVDISAYPFFGDMSEECFNQIVSGLKADEEKREEDARLAKEAKDAEDKKREEENKLLKAENIKLATAKAKADAAALNAKTELKKKEDAEEKAMLKAKEEEAQDKAAKKNSAYKSFLKKNGWTKADEKKFYIERVGDTFRLFKLVDTITI